MMRKSVERKFNLRSCQGQRPFIRKVLVVFKKQRRSMWQEREWKSEQIRLETEASGTVCIKLVI